MSERDETGSHWSAGETPIQISSTSGSSASSQIAFNRAELSEILKVYGRHVSEGEWRDYAIDFLRDRAVFSIFRRSSEVPLFRIEKNPKLSRRQGAFSVIASGGTILKRGQDLKMVLRVFEKKRHLRLVSS